MIFIYNLILIFSIILLSPLILMMFLIKSKFRAGFCQKIGFYEQFEKEDPDKKTVLFHAVSVGEVNAIENLIKTVRTKFPACEIVLSTTTKTGQEVAKLKLEKYTDKIVYFPYDLRFCVKRFLKSLQPDKIIIAETEIWPNFVSVAQKYNIPVYIINGRISPHSYDGYKKIRFFMKNVLSEYDKILMQTEGDTQRIIDIGALESSVVTMGNLKFDIAKTLNEEDVQKLAESFELNGNPLFIAASTHAGEDEIVLNVYEKVKHKVPNLKLLIAPRHPQRFDSVEKLVKNQFGTCGKCSEGALFSQNDIIMLDTMGQLSKMYSIAHVAFIGGSFSNTGGHNPLEANVWGVPVISGETVFNFKDIYKLLLERNVAEIVKNEEEFENILTKFLTDKDYYDKAVKNTYKIFEESSGAINKVIQEIF